jgi:hypothetical protein
MRRKRGPGPSHVLLTPDHAGNVVGVDPHKRTLTATAVDPRGGVLASEHFRVSGDGHRALRGVGSAVRTDCGRSPSCWSRSTTHAASPKEGSRGSTAPRRCRPRPRRDPASRSATATTRVATGGSTRSCTGWRSPSCAASPARSASTQTHAPTGTPRRRPAGSSIATSPTRSTAACAATSPPAAARPVQPPPRCMTARDPRAVKGRRARPEHSEPQSGVPLTAPGRAPSHPSRWRLT